MSTNGIVAIFNDRESAYSAARAIKDLEASGDGLTVEAGAMIGKDDKGNVRLLDEADRPLWGTGTGILVGGLLGLLAGPAGAVAGAAVGGLGGLAGDAVAGDLDQAFVDEVAQDLNPNDAALVIEVNDPSSHAVEDIVRRFGGRLHHTPV